MRKLSPRNTQFLIEIIFYFKLGFMRKVNLITGNMLWLPIISQKSKWWILHVCVSIESHPLEFKVYATADFQLTSTLWPRYNNTTVCVNTAPRLTLLHRTDDCSDKNDARLLHHRANNDRENIYRETEYLTSVSHGHTAFETFIPKRKPTFRCLLWTWAKTDLNHHRAQPPILLL